jgi:hypothetical protein
LRGGTKKALKLAGRQRSQRMAIRFGPVTSNNNQRIRDLYPLIDNKEICLVKIPDAKRWLLATLRPGRGGTIVLARLLKG